MDIQNGVYVPCFFFISFVFPYDVIHWVFMCLMKKKQSCINDSQYTAERDYNCSHDKCFDLITCNKLSQPFISNCFPDSSVASAFINLPVTIRGRKI